MGKSIYTPEMADKICERLAAGESLNAICKDDGYPSESTVRGWALDDVQGFSTKYARARDIGYDVMAESILRLADEANIGQKTVSKATGLEITEGDNVDRSRLQVEARKWLLSKMLPKKYGDRQHIEHSGKVGLESLIAGEDEKPD